MRYFFKRSFDIIFSSIGLLLTSPILLVVAIAIFLDSKGDVIFKQRRIGQYGKPYNMYKFRSMIPNAQNIGTGVYSFDGDPRITRVGRFLRKTSLDELPQLCNVFIGNMSLVGPRSPVVGHFPEYDTLPANYKRRFSVLPGITGLAQVVGRNEFSWDEKVEYDNLYIDKFEKYGVLYDIKILFMTVARVFSMSDVEERKENQEKNKACLTFNDEDSSKEKETIQS